MNIRKQKGRFYKMKVPLLLSGTAGFTRWKGKYHTTKGKAGENGPPENASGSIPWSLQKQTNFTTWQVDFQIALVLCHSCRDLTQIGHESIWFYISCRSWHFPSDFVRLPASWLPVWRAAVRYACNKSPTKLRNNQTTAVWILRPIPKEFTGQQWRNRHR